MVLVMFTLLEQFVGMDHKRVYAQKHVVSNAFLKTLFALLSSVQMG